MALKLTSSLSKGAVNANNIQNTPVLITQVLLGTSLTYSSTGWSGTPITVENTISGTINPNSNFSLISPPAPNEIFSLSNPTGAYNSKIIKLQNTNPIIISTNIGTFNLDTSLDSTNIVFNNGIWLKYNSQPNSYNFYPSKYSTSISGTDDVVNSNQGFSTSISGNGTVMASGAPFDNNYIGAVWIFTTIAGNWSQQTKIVPDGYIGTFLQIGFSVSLSTDGQTLAIGSPYDNGNIGATWIFVYSSFNLMIYVSPFLFIFMFTDKFNNSICDNILF